jgi:copper(I)-binding protein
MTSEPPATEPDPTETDTAVDTPVPDEAPAPAPAAATAGPPPDIYARIRRFAPALVVLFCAGLLVMVAVVRPFDSPPAAPELRTPLVGADVDPTGAYVVIHNAGGNDTLVGASTPAAATVEIQQRQGQTDTEPGVLVVVDQLAVPGFSDTRLQPGGDQLLLTDLVRPLAAGDTVELTLVFERAGSVTVDAQVESYVDIAERLLPPRLIIPGQDGGVAPGQNGVTQ